MPKSRKLEKYTNSIVPPRYQSASYSFNDKEEVVTGLHEKSLPLGRYGRYDNPSWLVAEAQLAELNKTEGALVFSSGMAAHSTTFLTLLSNGSKMAMPSESYRQVRKLCFTTLRRFGVDVTELSVKHSEAFLENLKEIGQDLDLLHLEMPSSPQMFLIDLEKIRGVVSDKTIITMDCSFAPPQNFLPHEHGVDIALYSVTKYLGGHGDILAGAATGSLRLLDRIKEVRDTTGGITDGGTAELISRSLQTLDMRVQKANVMGRQLADFLEGHELVDRVFYNGLSSHPHHELAKKYLRGHGGVVTFEVPGTELEVAHFVDLLQLPYMASNFGSHVSLVEQSTFFTYYEYSDEELIDISVPRTTVRYSVGYTDSIEEICADIDRALRTYKS